MVDLNMKAGHDLPGDLGDGGRPRVLGFLVGAAEADGALVNLDGLRLWELELGLVGKVLSDGICPDIDAAGINFALLEEEEVAGLGANIQKHGATFQIPVIVPEGVAQSGGGSVHELETEASPFSHAEETFDNLRLDGHQKNLQLAGRRGAKNLVIPDNLVQRERNVLLRFVANNLGHLGSVHRRQLDKFGKDME